MIPGSIGPSWSHPPSHDHLQFIHETYASASVCRATDLNLCQCLLSVDNLSATQLQSLAHRAKERFTESCRLSDETELPATVTSNLQLAFALLDVPQVTCVCFARALTNVRWRLFARLLSLSISFVRRPSHTSQLVLFHASHADSAYLGIFVTNGHRATTSCQ